MLKTLWEVSQGQTLRLNLKPATGFACFIGLCLLNTYGEAVKEGKAPVASETLRSKVSLHPFLTVSLLQPNVMPVGA